MPLTQAQRAQVQADKAQAQAAGTAGDAVAPSKNLATQNTGTDSGGTKIDSGSFDGGTGDGWEDSSSPVPTPTKKSNAEISDDALSQAAIDPIELGGVDQTRVVTPNPLSEFASYTYNINLHALTAADYKNMVENPDNFVPTRNIISGANRYNKPYTPNGVGTQRSTVFTDDFYFDGLSMTTVIGLNAETRSTNSVEIKFTIIEPYGMTLMNRLLDLNRDELDGANYLETPYLLEINFFGYDDEGNQITMTEQRKWICIKLINMQIRATGKGSEYAVQAVPFNYQGNFASTQVLKSNFNVTAGTVSDYFFNDITAEQVSAVDTFREQAANADANNKQRQQFNSKYQSDDEQMAAMQRGEAPPAPPPAPSTITTKSLPGAYNVWNARELANGNVGVVDVIRFNIDPDIASAKIVDPQKTTVRDVPATGVNTTSKANSTSNTGPQAVGPDLTQTVHNLNAGTQILAIIDMVMLNSDYILNQLNDPAIQAKLKPGQKLSAQKASDLLKGQPVNWYRVVPQVELTNFDRVRNKWGKIVTYNIQKYTYHNSRHPAADISLPPKPVKDYQYIYTGQNTEVINFDINFNALFFTAIQVNKASTTATNISKTVDDNAKNPDAGSGITKSSTGIQPVISEVVSHDDSLTAGQMQTRSDTQNAAALAKDIYTSAGADMINLKLDILGDPQFIKQDDIQYNPMVLGLNYNEQFVPSGTQGSLAMDNGEIFCTVTFKTPVDFDDDTGLLRTDGPYKVSYFSGYYKILTVESEFKGGKFTQKLNTVRYANQPEITGLPATGWDNVVDVERTADAAQTDKTNNPAISTNNIQKSANFVGPPQTSTSLPFADGDANVPSAPINNPNDLIDPYEQVPAEWPGTPSLSSIAKEAPTVPIGTGANAQGEPIVLAGAPG